MSEKIHLPEAPPAFPEPEQPEPHEIAERFEEEINSDHTEPHISFDIFYSPHYMEEDIEGMRELYEQCDVYAPEGGIEGMQKMYQSVIEGEKTPEEALQEIGFNSKRKAPGFFTRQLQILYNTHKPVIFIDPAASTKEKQKQRSETLVRINAKQDFDALLADAEEKLKRRGELETERERSMLENLKAQASDIAKTADKKNLRVLITLGAFHTGLHHDMVRAGMPTDKYFSELPWTYGYEAEALRRARFGKELSQSVLARSIFEMLLGRAYMKELEKVCRDTYEIHKLLYGMNNLFSEEEIRDIVNAARMMNTQGRTAYLTEELQKKGYALPDSPEEVQRLLWGVAGAPNNTRT